MSKEKGVPYGIHADHITLRNEHVKKAGVGVVVGGIVALANPVAGAIVGGEVVHQLMGAYDEHEARKKHS